MSRFRRLTRNHERLPETFVALHFLTFATLVLARYAWGSWPRLPGANWLDVKLGAGLLAKHPGITTAACLALAIGIPVGLVPPQLDALLNAPPPLHDGEPLV